jgi:Protein of unknown function (DUF2934)
MAMSSRYDHGSHYEKHPRAAELDTATVHAHETGELHGKQEHATAGEQSHKELEHVRDGQPHVHETTVGHGIAAFGHNDIAALAYQLWEARGCPEGSPDEDWSEAVKQLRLRATSHAQS